MLLSKEVDRIKKLVDWVTKIPDSEILWSIERLEYFQGALFEYSKFKVGDKVKLIEVPVIDEKTNWGWIGYKDYIIKGANATIIEIDHYGGTFRYMIEFDKCIGYYFSFNEIKLKRIKHAIHQQV